MEEVAGAILSSIISLLPDSPFGAFIMALDKFTWLSWLNWFVPISSFVAIGQAWLTAVGIYYIYQVILRYARAVE
jgi:hypothetical protein